MSEERKSLISKRYYSRDENYGVAAAEAHNNTKSSEISHRRDQYDNCLIYFRLPPKSTTQARHLTQMSN
jgi:hypothetical protein